MPFANASVPGESFLSQQVRPQTPVKDIGLGTVAMDAWRIAQEDADVVQHGRLFHETAVYLPFGVGIDNAQGLQGHATAMNQENAP